MKAAPLQREEERVPITKRYQTGLVVLFFFTWGSVFLARMSVLYLTPFIAPDLHLSHAQVGLLASALALAWAGSGLVFGAVSDRIGRRPVLIPTVFLFSALSWLSGIARSFAELLFMRTLMGIAEGPTWPTMTSMIEASSEPKTRGRNIGIVVSAGALVGLALAPVLTTQIAKHFGWRSAFFVAGVPGIILGLLIWKFVKEPEKAEAGAHHHAKPSLTDYLSLLRYRNMLLCCLGAAGFMTWLFVYCMYLRRCTSRKFRAIGNSGGVYHRRGGGGRFFVGLDFSMGFRSRRAQTDVDFCRASFRYRSADLPGPFSDRASMADGGRGLSCERRAGHRGIGLGARSDGKRSCKVRGYRNWTGDTRGRNCWWRDGSGACGRCGKPIRTRRAALDRQRWGDFGFACVSVHDRDARHPEQASRSAPESQHHFISSLAITSGSGRSADRNPSDERPEAVAYVVGTFCYPCVRVGPTTIRSLRPLFDVPKSDRQSLLPALVEILENS